MSDKTKTPAAPAPATVEVVRVKLNVPFAKCNAGEIVGLLPETAKRLKETVVDVRTPDGDLRKVKAAERVK